MRNRLELAQYLAEMGSKKGAEVGVFEGTFSKTILDTIPGVNLLCIDSWNSPSGWGLRRNRSSYPAAIKNLSAYPNATILKGNSVDVAKYIVDESLDFVYIDADHSYEAVKADINYWAPKVKSGGVLSGHDYFEADYLGVIRAVDEYAKEHNLKVSATEWDKRNPVRDERQPNWYFIKA